MPVEVILPKVDMDMTHGTLATWHVQEGEKVEKGAALFDIETDKAAMEVEAPATGRLHHLAARPGDKVPVGSVVGWLYAEGEAVDTQPPGAREASVADAKTAVAPEKVPEPVASTEEVAVATPEPQTLQKDVRPNDVVRATPAARAAARAEGIDLEGLAGSGPRGRIQRDDVKQALALDRSGPFSGAPAGWTPQAGPLSVSRRSGSGAPLVLLHGFTADSTGWMHFEKALARHRTLIRIDMPGHGKSPKRHVRDFSQLARMMVEAFDDATRGLDGVHLLGHSLGGALAAAIADIRGRRIHSLTAIAPAGLGPEISAAPLNGIARASRPESLLPWLRELTGDPDLIGEDYAKAAMRSRSDAAMRACQMEMADRLFPDGVQAFDIRPALSRLPMPVALLWGRSDRILPYKHALSADGDFAIHFLSGIGHMPHFECPERVARIVERQFAAVEAPG